MILKIKEAVEAKEGLTLFSLAKKIWPEASENAQRVNISKLTTGKTKRVEMDWVKIICEETGKSPDFLFGYSNKKFNW